jgi:hypothetical protein
MTPQWNIINVGKGIYHLKCLHEGFYVGWEEKDLDDGGKVVMSKTPYCWAITSSSSGTHQYVVLKLINRFHACVEECAMQVLGRHE